MRTRRLIIWLLLILACVRGEAKPARPGLLRHVQPDGSTLLLRLEGDERGHYALDQEGRVLEMDAQGFYRLSPTPERALRRRMVRQPRYRAPFKPVPSHLRTAVILVEFQDVHFGFSQPLRHFERLLSQPGYGEDGATGSVRDFYRDNSHGQFEPEFEVFGPVRLSRKRIFYGADDSFGEDQAAESAFLEACRLLEGEIDFSRFDEDGDGVIDHLAFFYAGHDESEGAPSEAIWSHHGNFAESAESSIRDARLDGLAPGEYICMAELQGADGSRPMGIGSTCHELAHTLGLPDFYDVDGGRDGMAGGLYQFSTMSLGLYNNDGRTPPYFNALERLLLGWMPPENILPLPWDDAISVSPVQEDQAYRSGTDTEGEFFLYECRSAEGWDAPLPPGMVIYHIDQSQRIVGNLPAAVLWEDWRVYNNLNNRGKHPCFYLVPAVENTALNYPGALSTPGNLVFPGNGRVFTFEPMDWNDAPCGVQLVCIFFEDGKARARVVRREGRYLCGEFRDTEGKPVSSVTISVEGLPPALSSLDGFFLLPLAEDTPERFLLTATKGGYRPFEQEITMGGGQRIHCLPFTLLRENMPGSIPLSKWDRQQSRGYFPTGEAALGAVCLTPEDLAPYALHRLSRVVCYPFVGETDPGQLFVTVDIGGERVLTREVQGTGFLPYEPVVVDISDADIRIPEGQSIYVGYGFDGGGPLAVVYPGVAGASFWKPLADASAPWQEVCSPVSGYHMDVMVDAVATEVPGDTLEEMGYAYIDPGTGTPLAGEAFVLKVRLPEGASPEISWTYDGMAVKGPTVTLEAGEHVLRAVLEYPNGRQETLQMDFKI